MAFTARRVSPFLCLLVISLTNDGAEAVALRGSAMGADAATTTAAVLPPPPDTDAPTIVITEDGTIFYNPKLNDLPIDYCMSYKNLDGPEKEGVDCGEPVAIRFCKSQGYRTSTDHMLMSYSHKSTYVLGMDIVNPESNERGLGSHSFFSAINCGTTTGAVDAVTTAFTEPAN